MSIVYIKTAVSVTLALLLIGLLWQRSTLTALLQRAGTWVLDVCWIALRLVPFLATYIVMGYQPQSDVATFYYPIGMSALEGGIPYRDVYSCYSPLFGYWLAPFLSLWSDMRMVVLAMMVVEGLAVRLTFRHYQIQETMGQRLFRGVFYYFLPLPFVMCVFSGQEDVILWLFALLAIPLMQSRPFLAGLVLGLGMLATKAVFILLLIPVWLLTLRNAKFAAWFTAGLVTVGLPVALFIFWKAGLLFLDQQSHEGDYLKAPNWRSILNPFLSDGLRSAVGIWKWGGLILTLLIMLQGVWRIHKTRSNWRYQDYLPFIYILTYSAMSVLQQNAISNYAYLFMLPLVFTITDFRRLWFCVGLIGFNILAAIHPSLWWRLGMPYYDRLSALAKPTAALEYSIEILIFIGFIYYAIQAMNALRRPKPVAQAEPYAV
ncbi:DUF2029 domain-containing protein [Spirosoma aureum]|uniref:DUF2029 domain-containing protein n=1 Tax=Spirosoma aureum TaxID=2692134 RepID=A0A6G9APB8_9BACT|nr:DUF2029 domain-containing protein [Spirosoma aureum]QIP14331.1 DUF2029 domain-containing protein [Spirosoma aureum]